MIIREIVATCSNPHVARAAVASIGGEFARRVARDAAARHLSSGMLASRLVRDFARQAGDGDWEGLSEAIRGADTPVLDGLRHILERGLEFGKEDYSPSSLEQPDRAWAGCWTTRSPSAFCGEAGVSCT